MKVTSVRKITSLTLEDISRMTKNVDGWQKLPAPLHVFSHEGDSLAKNLYKGTGQTWKVLFSNGETLEGLRDHKLLVGKEWTTLDKLVPGDTLLEYTTLGFPTGEISVVDCYATGKVEVVYDLDVPGPRSYLVNGVMSHNSAMSLQLAYNMAMWGAKVCIVALEMSAEEMLTRRIASLTKVPMTKLINPSSLTFKEKKLIKEKYKEYKNTLRRKGAVETYMVPDEDMTIEEVLFSLKPHCYDVIMIDYLGLLKGVDGDDQWRQLSNAARFAKRFATPNDCQIIVCAQLSDEGAIRYSRAIKEHSSNMWSWAYSSSARETHIIEVIQQKSRNQSGHSFKLVEDFSTMSFEDYEGGDDKGSNSKDSKEDSYLTI